MHKFLGNTKGSDQNEWIELKNTGNVKINLIGVLLDDELEKGSKAYKINENIYLQPGKVKRFYKGETKLNLNNDGDSINLIYNDEVIDSFKWDFVLGDGYIVDRDKLSAKFSEVHVERVVDGDTILIRFEDGKTSKLRLIGVDTPETVDPRKEIESFGKEVSNFTKTYLDGKTVTLEQDSENIVDKYGRLLGYIYIKSENGESIFFNKLLIEKGYARVYLYFPFKYSEEFKASENKAKKDKVGIWGVSELKKQYLSQEKEEKKYLEVKEEKEKKSVIDIIKEEPIENSLVEVKSIVKDKNNKLLINLKKYSNNLLSWNFPKTKNKTIVVKKEKTVIKESKKIKFTQTITKQVKALKISGTTVPNSKVLLTIGAKNYEVFSGKDGKYSLKVDTLEAGNYEVISKVFGNTGQILGEKTKELSLTKGYNPLDKKVTKAKKVKSKKIKFTNSVLKQKKALKISGTTVPNSKIVIFLGSQKIETTSAKNGKYSVKLTKLASGNYDVITRVYSKIGVLLGQKIKKVKLDTAYVNSVRLASIKKVKTKKIGEKKLVVKVNNLKKGNESSKTRDYFGFFKIFDIIIGIIVVLGGLFVLLRKEYLYVKEKIELSQNDFRCSIFGILGFEEE